jgi:hypothetical protein
MEDLMLSIETLKSDKYKTGGILNAINERYNLNSTSKTVPIIKLYDYHNPKSFKECELLIESHTANGSNANCPCGCKSKGTLNDFANNLWNKVQEEQLELSTKTTTNQLFNITEQCHNFIIGLFVKNSLIGLYMEQLLIEKLTKALPENRFVRAESDMDRKYSVDILVYKGDTLIKGIQVKPSSYDRVRNDIKMINDKNNQAFKKDFNLEEEVKYIYYDFKNIKFIQEKYNTI